MPKYLDQEGVAYLWSKIQKATQKNLVYQSNTTENWNKKLGFISEKNVLYIYTDYRIIEKDGEEILLPGLKVGDGKSYLIDLPFLNSTSDIDQVMIDHINNNVIHISAEERAFWNNKLNYQLQDEILVLNRQ